MATTIAATPIIWLCSAIRTALHRASRAMHISPTPVRANKPPMTLAVNGVSFHGQRRIIRSGRRNRKILMSRVIRPMPPMTKRTDRGTMKSLSSGVPGSVCRLRSQAPRTRNGVVKYRIAQAKTDYSSEARCCGMSVTTIPGRESSAAFS